MENTDLPVPFEEKIHRPVELGFRRAERRDVFAEAIGEGVAAFTRSVLDGLFR